jgi:hypothetical protein
MISEPDCDLCGAPGAGTVNLGPWFCDCDVCTRKWAPAVHAVDVCRVKRAAKRKARRTARRKARQRQRS